MCMNWKRIFISRSRDKGKSMEKEIEVFWTEYSFIYNTTKELYIMAEEYDEDFSSFIQPIKEQRDSLEHIVRAYSRMSSALDVQSEEVRQYISSNLSKALGHIFRAFFDCADVLGIILRERLSIQLREYSYRQIMEVWPDYEKYRKRLVVMPKEFAKMRTEKDIAQGTIRIIDMVKSYKALVDELFVIYDEFVVDIYPHLKSIPITL